jgi:hypothetical protein
MDPWPSLVVSWNFKHCSGAGTRSDKVKCPPAAPCACKQVPTHLRLLARCGCCSRPKPTCASCLSPVPGVTLLASASCHSIQNFDLVDLKTISPVWKEKLFLKVAPRSPKVAQGCPCRRRTLIQNVPPWDISRVPCPAGAQRKGLETKKAVSLQMFNPLASTR